MDNDRKEYENRLKEMEARYADEKARSKQEMLSKLDLQKKLKATEEEMQYLQDMARKQWWGIEDEPDKPRNKKEEEESEDEDGESEEQAVEEDGDDSSSVEEVYTEGTRKEKNL